MKNGYFRMFLFSLMFVTGAWAATPEFAPESFSYSNGKAVYVDFQKIDYHIVYNTPKKETWIKTTMTFQSDSVGYPVFDSVTTPINVKIDGVSTSAPEINAPAGGTKFRVLATSVEPGTHTLTMDVKLTNGVKYDANGVRSGFFMCDLSDRCFLEEYMPASFEFDQVQMNWRLTFIGSAVEQRIYTNGAVTKIDANDYAITFPAHYVVSSPYVHTAPTGAMKEREFVVASMDGRKIPAIAYVSPDEVSDTAGRLVWLENKTKAVIKELEGDYGAFLHHKIVVYNSGGGGMEYCGATITSTSALAHELTHSYFARGMMPARGNSGWIDEALASWRDDGYQRQVSLNGTSGMSAHSDYVRWTDRAAYSFGAEFMAHMDHQFKEKGGLKKFLRYMIGNHAFHPYSMNMFITLMSSFYGEEVEEVFRHYTYDASMNGANHKLAPHPFHGLTKKDLVKFL